MLGFAGLAKGSKLVSGTPWRELLCVEDEGGGSWKGNEWFDVISSRVGVSFPIVNKASGELLFSSPELSGK